jgi:putative DNA methylase
LVGCGARKWKKACMTDHPIKSPRKLIEVALPLDAINAACAREKSIRHGHPSTLHLWWARRPLAAARAVIFAQLVNDPGYQQGGGFKYGKNKKEAAIERKRLFKIIEDLVLWENTTNEEVLERARAEIRRSWREVCELNKDHPQAAELFNPDKLPALHDPFAGGGSIPLEAQRLGLEAYASDLNPVPILINKAMIEIPPKFAGKPPVNPEALNRGERSATWPRASGLAEDVRYYGEWINNEAQKIIGGNYPAVEIVGEVVRDRPELKSLLGHKIPVIAWIWARTVKSPNPAFSQAEVPLASTFVVYSKSGRQAYVHPIIEGDRYQFVLKTGVPPAEAENGTKANGRGANFRCILSGSPISGDYIKAEGQAGRIGMRLLAIVADGPSSRIYLSPNAEHEKLASQLSGWKAEGAIPPKLTGGTCVPYGLTEWGDLFTKRQRAVLTVLSDLVGAARKKALHDSLEVGLAAGCSLESGGTGATAYSEAISVYLGFCVSKLTAYHCCLAIWRVPEGKSGRAFGRQSIPMVWDFPECNPFLDAGGGWLGATRDCAKVINTFFPEVAGRVKQSAAQSQPEQPEAGSSKSYICTDPPYYDNVAYADISDFFYVWLRRTLRDVFPKLLATIAVPKFEELVATAYRHGGKEQAEIFFMTGMTVAMKNLLNSSREDAPTVIYYAFKQSDSSTDGTTSTGWETFLEAVLRAGFSINGTWPMRTEQSSALKTHVNSLASSIVLVCRKRPADAPSISRREFIRELNGVLPEALDEMTKGSGDERSPVAPVDLSQAIIGPGMAVFSKYAAVLEADGSPMSVRTALQLINRFLAEDDFDADTQFCLHWFEQHGWTDGAFGDADTLSRGKGTSVDGIKDAGVIQSGGGKVRLLKWAEYPANWDPRTDARTPVWEALHHLIRALKQGGESASGALLAALGGKAESVRQLAYRLYTLCERLGQAEDARAYNELITSWTGIESAAAIAPKPNDGLLPGFDS